MRDFDTGIDLTVHEVVRIGGQTVESGFRLDIQAKSTIGAQINEEVVHYDLKMRNYEALRDPRVPVPRILVLLVLPRLESDWMAQDQEGLLLRRCAYWASLLGKPKPRNLTTVRIAIDRQNVFSPEALRMMMARLGKGKRL